MATGTAGHDASEDSPRSLLVQSAAITKTGLRITASVGDRLRLPVSAGVGESESPPLDRFKLTGSATTGTGRGTDGVAASVALRHCTAAH